jgi:phage protein D
MMIEAISYPVRAPMWRLVYSGVDITGDISPMVTAVAYTDRLGGRAGEISVDIGDRTHVGQSDWYPSLGDRVSLWIGYTDEQLLPCGDFQVDNLELDGPPRRVPSRCSCSVDHASPAHDHECRL